MAGKKKQLRKPGSQARAESATLGQVIEGESQEVQAMDGKEGSKATESAQVEEVTEVTAEQVGGADVEVPSRPTLEEEETKAPEDGGSVTLANGSEITDETIVQCGRCGARFYAKDCPDGTCPAVGVDPARGAEPVTCGGTVGPVSV